MLSACGDDSTRLGVDAGLDAGDVLMSMSDAGTGGRGGSQNDVPDASMDDSIAAGGTTNVTNTAGSGGEGGSGGSNALPDGGLTSTVASGGSPNAQPDPCALGIPLGLEPEQVAARLARLLWASAADAELVERAERLAISDANAAACFAADMLDDPRTETGIWTFFRAWLGIDDLATLEKDRNVFPLFGEALRRDFRDELRTFVVDHFHADSPLTALFDGNHVFVNERLANVYGIAGVTGEDFEKQPAPNGRGGILTQGWFLALGATSTRSSPSQRGRRVWERLLCGPALEFDHLQVEIEWTEDESLTTREQHEQRTSLASQCQSCHTLIDPIGYTFEYFDGLGQFRLEENGQAIDTSAQGRFPNNQTWQAVSALGFSALAAGSGQISQCLSNTLLTYTLGRPATNQSDALSLSFIRSNVTSLRLAFLAAATSPSYLAYQGLPPTPLPELQSVTAAQLGPAR